MMDYMRRPAADAVASAFGRLLIVYLFVGAAAWHLRSAGWAPTIADMQGRGVPFPRALLVAAMTVSSLASLALLLDLAPKRAAYALAAYTIIVSSIMHNPLHSAGPDFFLFVKDMGIAGVLLALGAGCEGPLTSGRVSD